MDSAQYPVKLGLQYLHSHLEAQLGFGQQQPFAFEADIISVGAGRQTLYLVYGWRKRDEFRSCIRSL